MNIQLQLDLISGDIDDIEKALVFIPGKLACLNVDPMADVETYHGSMVEPPNKGNLNAPKSDALPPIQVYCYRERKRMATATCEISLSTAWLDTNGAIRLPLETPIEALWPMIRFFLLNTPIQEPTPDTDGEVRRGFRMMVKNYRVAFQPTHLVYGK